MLFDQQNTSFQIEKKPSVLEGFFRLLFIDTLILTYLKREFPSERKAA